MVNGHQVTASDQQVAAAAFNTSNSSRRQDAFHESNMMMMTSASASEQRQQQQQQQQHLADLHQQRSLAPGSEQLSGLVLGGGGGGANNNNNNNNNNRTEGNQLQQQQQQQKRFRPQKFCSVCGDKAIACNFNAVTCESCKAFFRRNAYKEQRLKCLFESRCLITKDTRRFCSKCRLLKCFAIGMKREWILTDEQKHSKRIKIIQNKETKQKQLASITAAQHATPKQATSSSASSVGTISVGTLGGHHQRYNGGLNAPRISSSCSPANQQHCGELRSEASSPTTTNTATTTTTTAKNSLNSSREASISLSDSHADQQVANLPNNMSPPMQQHQQMPRSLIEMKDASTSTSTSGTTSSSSSTGGNHEDQLQVLFPICSWSTQCHFCAMKLAANNTPLAPTMMAASGGAAATGGNIGGAGGFDLINETTSITKDFRNNRPANYSTDELGGARVIGGVGAVGGGSQVQLTSSRLFYSAVPGGAAGSDGASGLVELDETNTSPTKLHASMMASTYVGNDNNHLLQLTSGSNATSSAVSRPVTNYCFNPNSNVNAATDHHQQHDDQQQHHGSAPMNSMETDNQQQQQQQQLQHNHQQQLQQQQQHYNITSYPSSTTEDSTGGAGNLLCFPLSNSLNNNGRHHQQQQQHTISHHPHDHQSHHPLMGSHHQTLPTCFIPARRSGLEHFNFPSFAGQSAIASSSPNYGSHPAMTAVKAYDLQVVTQQQQHPHPQQQQSDRIINESKDNLCSLNQTNDTHTTSSPSSNLTGCSPIDGTTTTGTGTGGGGDLTNNNKR